MHGRKKENPILLPAVNEKFLNVVGLMNQKKNLFHEILEIKFNTYKFICFMNNFIKQTVKKTVVILGKSPIQKSKKFIAKIKEWIGCSDVLIYFLPAYSPELNLIEILWKKIKYQWIPFNAYLCFKNLKKRLKYLLNNIGISILTIT